MTFPSAFLFAPVSMVCFCLQADSPTGTVKMVAARWYLLYLFLLFPFDSVPVCFNLPAVCEMMKVPTFCDVFECFLFSFFCRDVCKDESNGRPLCLWVFFLCILLWISGVFLPLSLLRFFGFLFLFPSFSLLRALLCSAFYKARELALKPVLPLQECYPSTNGIVGRGRGHDWVGFAVDFLASLFNRDEENEHVYSTSNGAVSVEMDNFILTPELWKSNNWIPNN